MPPSVERKLAAILSADVVGYSRLMAEDEDETVRRIGAYRTEVTNLVGEHRGRVVDFTGDNFLAEFPTATDAAEAAAEIQRVIKARNAAVPAGRAMEFRIGIHLGEVRVEDGRLFGDGVNIAARLEGLSEPGGICISAQVLDQVRRKLELGFEDLGEQTVKNIPDPVHAYRLREAPAGAVEPKPNPLPRRAVAAAIVIAAAVLAFAVWQMRSPAPDPETVAQPAPELPPLTSVAVLPFNDMSQGGDQGWLADGMTEELIEMLSRIEELSVIARSSSFVLRGQDIETVGKRLGVGAVVEGSLRRAGDQLRITAQLIRVSDGSHIWAARYDRDAEDVLAAQSTIAREIAEGVRTELGIPFELPRSYAVERYLPSDVRAYQLWKRAIVRMSTLTEEGLLEGQEYVLQALEIDPEYARAWAQLGWSHQNLWLYGYDMREERRSDARAAALRALESDPANADAHELLGNLALIRNHFEEAERIVTAALEQHPSHPGLLQHYSFVLAETGRYQDAVRHAHRSAELDPLWATRHKTLGGVLAIVGEYDAAIEKVKHSLEMDPKEPGALSLLARLHHLNGEDEEALEALIRFMPESEASLRRGFSAGGYAGALRTRIAEWTQSGTPCGAAPSFGAEVYALIGEADSSYHCLNEAFDRTGRIWLIRGNPVYAPYRDDPRFTALLERMYQAEE
jgi:TolB-like protein/class 3 adenylate cyclase/Flp pilus assembly protein TadD